MNGNKKMRNGGVIIALVLIVVVLAFAVGGDNDAQGKPKKEKTEEAEEAEPVVEPLDPSECPDGRPIIMADHEGNRVAAEGLISVESNAVKMQIAGLAAGDPTILALYYNASPLGETDPVEVAILVEGGGGAENGKCVSAEGVARYNEWLVLWRVTEITPVDSMPPGWGNTGVNGNTPTYGGAPSGDTSGVVVVYVDANGKEIGKHGVMKRCVNPVTPAPPPGIPEGPTDENPPEPPPGTPTTEPPPGGKDYGNITPGVETPVEPERPREPPPAEPVTPTTEPNGPPATTLVPTIPNNPECPGGHCPTHPVPTTVAPPATVPSTTTPPSTRPPRPGSG